MLEVKASKYISDEFFRLGLSPIGENFHHDFTYQINGREITSRNVAALKQNASDSIIVITAHFDHLGLGGEKSRSLKSNRIHPGADDNASGVALMLAIAHYLANSDDQNYSFLFLAPSGHEDGLFGSSYFVKHNPQWIEKVKFVINLDMVGRLDKNSKMLKITRSDTFQWIDTFFQKSNSQELNFRFNDDYIENSDAWPFIQQNIPAITISTGIHDDYHKVSDTPDKINYDGMLLIFDFTKNLILNLNKQDFGESNF